jgi:transposase
VTKEEFIDWIKAEVLIRIVRGSILIIDNASIHYSERLTELVINAGCFLEYLLPYSPDFNPIEQLFNVLKSWIKRHRQQASDFDDFGAFLMYAIRQSMEDEEGATRIRAYFKKSGYE